MFCKKKTALLAAFLVSLLVTISAPVIAENPTGVTLTQAQSTQLSQTLFSTGSLAAWRSTELRTQAQGRITELHLEDGARVQAGQLLVQLDDREVQARLRQAQVSLDEARRQLARFQQLSQTQAISRDQLEAQQAKVETAEAQVLSAQAELDRYRIVAPFDGVLGEHDATLGMLVDAGARLTTLDDLSRLRIDFTLAERHLSLLRPGLSIQALSLAWPDHTFEGELVSLGTRVDPVTRNLPLRGQLDNPDGLLRPGMLVNLQLQTLAREAIVVPARSLTYSGNEKAVFVVNAEGRAQRRLVETGLSRAEMVEITSGLEAGETVVDQGVVRVRDGMRVRDLSLQGDA